MFNAPSLLRTAIGLFGCVLAMALGSTAGAQTIDISLNVFYEDPSDEESGGTWQVVAKTGAAGGIGQLSLRLDNIDSTVQFDAPRGTVNGSNGAGFWILANSPQGDHRNITIGQAGLGPTDFEPGDEQTIFYGVGLIPNGEPGDLGPTFGSLTNVQGVVPWAPVPPGDPDELEFGDTPTWDVAALFVSGTFPDGITPTILASTTGQVFTSVGTSTTFAPFMTASINTIVRTNSTNPGTGLDGDFNEDGVVDAADYVTWRKNNGGGTALPNDGGLGTPISQAHYDLWAANFGDSAPGGGSGGLGAAVPEPTTGLLLALGMAIFCGKTTRRPRAR
jgi:hypothetical protein